jgi:hypothetical protein
VRLAVHPAVFLFSALGGQFGEKFAKDALIRAIKLAEIAIMAVGALGFITNHLALMLVALFGMGTHSALFGPVKYSILPQACVRKSWLAATGWWKPAPSWPSSPAPSAPG